MTNLMNFLGCTLLFAAALFACAFLGEAGILILGIGAVLALLWMIAGKLDQINEKLDELLKKRDGHDME